MNTPFHLYQLQLIDTKIAKLDFRLQEISKILKNDPILIEAKSTLEMASKELDSAKTSLQKLESKIQEKRNKLEQSESSLYGGKIKNPKELQDLQKEITSIKNVIVTLEEEQLDLMISVEEKEKQFHEADRDYLKATSNNANTNVELTSEIKTISQEKGRLLTERNFLANQVPVAIFKKYDDLRSSKGGVAVAGVEDQTCTMCGASLTPSECQSAKSPSILFFCPSCGRILYAD